MRATAKRIFRSYILSITFWQLLSLVMAWQEYMWDQQEGVRETFFRICIPIGIRCLVVALLTPTVFRIVDRHPVQKGRLWLKVLAYGAGFVPFLLVFSLIHWLIYDLWVPKTGNWMTPRELNLTAAAFEYFADVLFLYLGILLAAHASTYFFRLRTQEREQLELRQALSQTQLQVLRNQMQPHFLFNTLHGIATLIETQPARARSMIVTVSDLLRKSVRHAETDLITLGEDIQFANDYLTIEQMRLGDRMTVDWGIGSATKDLLVPHFILQPLIENAIKHGVACSPDGGWIQIESAIEGPSLKLRVSNSIAEASTAETGNGVGNANLAARLRCLYGKDAYLTFRSEPGIATAELALPALRGFKALERRPA